ncbi:hypothetical protein FACS189442_2040 [Spirochaetia bacterium]|nr:hypothetical protein FACS189442_2040 [Spirochaetia bacterium]
MKAAGGVHGFVTRLRGMNPWTGPPIIHLRAREEARLQGVLDFQYIVIRSDQWQRCKQTLYMRPE